MIERRKRLVPPDERDFELARAIDARKASPMSAITKMNSSMIANAMHSGMMKKKEHSHQDPNAVPVPSGMRVDRVAFPATEKKHPQGMPQKAEVPKEPEAEKLLKVANKRIEILENENEDLKKTVEMYKRAVTALKNKPTEIQRLLEFLHYDTVELLIKDVNAYKVHLQKAAERKRRYDERHGYA